MPEEEELEEIRRKRLQQLQQQSQQQADQDVQRRAQEEQRDRAIESVLRQVLDADARERLQRIKIARPDQARVLEEQLVGLAQSGRLRSKITDQDLKNLLTRLFPPKRETKIRRLGEE